ncbi:MAG TPA: MBL fold metallo-hydrolase [Candidatus Paceibacterota bacterium]|nr:MBL fold metallo-hydrolase [Candidatus Paceibacterota bacterium]
MQFLRRYFSYLILAALVLISIGIWSVVWAETAPGKLIVAVLDVGQGDSIFIESPTGVQIIIDGGPDNSLLHDLPHVMPLSDRSIDAVLATHLDADHITGFIDLLKRYSVGAFIESGLVKSTLTARTLEKEVDAEKIPRTIARRGMSLDLGGGAYLDVLSPDYDVSILPEDKGNEGCIVAHLVYGKTSMLLMCDASMDVEDHIMALGSLPTGQAGTTQIKSDILKVGHHGSHSSTGDEFVSEVDPSVAIISVGAHNTYGHPAEQTLDTLAAHNVETLRTDEEGTIKFISNGEKFVRD